MKAINLKTNPLAASGTHRLLPKLLLSISVVTVLTGAVQVVATTLVLSFIGASTDKTSAHFFAIIGMFMVLFGGLLWQTLRKVQVAPEPVFWCGLQKLGAALAVGLGVWNGIFSGLALGVAFFDFLSGILIFSYWQKIKNRT